MGVGMFVYIWPPHLCHGMCVCVCVCTKGMRLMPKHLYDTAQSKLHMKVTVLLLLLYYYYFILCPTSFLTVNVNKVLSLEILEHSLSSVSRIPFLTGCWLSCCCFALVLWGNGFAYCFPWGVTWTGIGRESDCLQLFRRTTCFPRLSWKYPSVVGCA